MCCCAAESAGKGAQPTLKEGYQKTIASFLNGNLGQKGTQWSKKDEENPSQCRIIILDALRSIFGISMVATADQRPWRAVMVSQPTLGRRDGARTPATLPVSESPPGCHENT